MKVVVTGGTGRVGTEVVKTLLNRGASVRVLTRNKEARFPAGVEAALGDLLNPDSVRAALHGADKLFLLVAGAADELTQALLAFNIARQMKVKHLTYLSIDQAERFPEVPHINVKAAVETALKAFEVPFTSLRAGYFFQNDIALKAPLTGLGLYPVSMGSAELAAIDVRDIADAAAISLTTEGHAGKTYNLVVSAPLSGPGAAAAWTKALGKPVRYADPSLDGYEEQLRQVRPAWQAMDLRVMLQAFQERGFAPTAADGTALTRLIGHNPRRYEDFVRETAATWANGPTSRISPIPTVRQG